MKMIITGAGRPILSVIFTLCLFLSCNDVKPQSPKEIKAAKIAAEKENVRQFLLGAMKVCQDTDYISILGESRDPYDVFGGKDCCANYIKPPYVNPYEYYLHLFEGDNSIQENLANPFELKKVREKMQGRLDDVKDMVADIDSQNLVYHSNEDWFINKYDMGAKTMGISGVGLSYGRLKLGEILHGGGKSIVKVERSYALPMSESQAENLIKSINQKSPNKSKAIHSKITYSLKKPEKLTGGIDLLEIHFKKIEFYPIGDMNNKIGEVIF